MKKTSENRNRGAVLALVMIVVLLLSLTSLVVMSMAQHARVRAVCSVQELSARCAADAGVQHVLYLMNKSLSDNNWNVSDLPAFTNEPLANSGAVYSVSLSGSPSAGYQITSIGDSGQRSRTVRVTIALNSPLSNFAVFTKGKLDMKNKATIDAYDSGNPSDTDKLATIGTGSTADNSMIFKNKTVVNGDVYLYPGIISDDKVSKVADSVSLPVVAVSAAKVSKFGRPPVASPYMDDVAYITAAVDSVASAEAVKVDPDKIISGKDAIKGQVLTMPQPVVVPTVAAPSFLGSKGKIQNDNQTLTAADSGKYSGIDISKGKLTISGDVVLYVTGSVDLKNSASIEIKPNSSLSLYVDGDVDLKNSAGVNNAGRIPSNFRLIGTGQSQTIDFKNDSDFYGVIFAPNADTVIHNSGDIYGSIVSDNLEIKNSGNIHYDKALKKADVNVPGVQFVITRWEEM